MFTIYKFGNKNDNGFKSFGYPMIPAQKNIRYWISDISTKYPMSIFLSTLDIEWIKNHIFFHIRIEYEHRIIQKDSNLDLDSQVVKYGAGTCPLPLLYEKY